MTLANSPLRYPGGKASLSGLLSRIVAASGLQDGTYVEPYAGGAGAALNLLFGNHVQHIVLNDADPSIHAVWHTILHDQDPFLERLHETPVTMDEWRKQRDVYRRHEGHSQVDIAFATFFLNRCNRSGILVGGGPIGGVAQAGQWKLDARFNKKDLAERIERVHDFRDRIEVYNLDAIDFLQSVVAQRTDLDRTLVYLDPPYFVKGKDLYLNYYRPADHATLASFIQQQTALRWLMTYDDVPQIRLLYAECATITLEVDYSAHTRKRGQELLIHGDGVVIPDDGRVAV